MKILGLKVQVEVLRAVDSHLFEQLMPHLNHLKKKWQEQLTQSSKEADGAAEGATDGAAEGEADTDGAVDGEADGAVVGAVGAGVVQGGRFKILSGYTAPPSVPS